MIARAIYENLKLLCKSGPTTVSIQSKGYYRYSLSIKKQTAQERREREREQEDGVERGAADSSHRADSQLV